ncbi:MAG: hypothetical protein HY831_05315 [Candidatus Aenigmarchaeota archaeon]|nr:hypothetical protein [Candidatus Aenigmarchaeota archaeon]
MKITICASIDFTHEIGKINDFLKEKGHDVNIPQTAEKILSGKLTWEEYRKEKQSSERTVDRKVNDNVIKIHYEKIKQSDAIFVVNIDKKGIQNYIGGNTFLEIGFAYVLNKKIFLLNDIPEMFYTDEIKAMKPIILNGDLEKIR